MIVKVLYFASLKEHMLRGQDNVDLPPGINTVERLKNYLSEKDPLLKEAFENMPRLRCSVNQEMASDRHHVKDGDEVAFFPPVTGG